MRFINPLQSILRSKKSTGIATNATQLTKQSLEERHQVVLTANSILIPHMRSLIRPKWKLSMEKVASHFGFAQIKTATTRTTLIMIKLALNANS